MRYLPALAALLAVATASAELDITNPVIGNEELAGVETVVSLTIPPGLDAGGIMTDGETIEVSFDLIGVNNQQLFGPFAVNTIGGPVNYVDALGNSILADLGTANFLTAAQMPSVTSIRMKCRTSSATQGEYVEARFRSIDENVDEIIDIVLPDERPHVIAAVANISAGILRLDFSAPLTTYDPANSLNQTSVLDIDGNDFQFSKAPAFSGDEPSVTGISNARFKDGDPSRLVFDFDPLASNLSAGGYIRPAYEDTDATPANAMSVRGIFGYPAASDAVRVFVRGTCPSDLNNDLVTDSLDLAIVLSGWGDCPDPPVRATPRPARAPTVAPRGFGPIDITNPIDADQEFAGLETVVSMTIAPGLNSGGIMADAEAIEVAFDLIDAMGNVIFGPFALNTVGGVINYVDAVGNSIQVDLAEVNFVSATGNPAVTGIRMKCRTSSGAPLMFVEAAFDAADEGQDEVLEFIPRSARPALTSAIADGHTSTLTLTFSAALSNFNPDNNSNNTVPEFVNGADFQLGLDPIFYGDEAIATGISNARFVDGDPTTLVFDFDPQTSNIIFGGYIRPAYDDVDDTPADTMSIRDPLGYTAASDAVELIVQGACPSDANRDGVTDAFDLAIVLAGWGACPDPPAE